MLGPMPGHTGDRRNHLSTQEGREIVPRIGHRLALHDGDHLHDSQVVRATGAILHPQLGRVRAQKQQEVLVGRGMPSFWLGCRRSMAPSSVSVRQLSRLACSLRARNVLCLAVVGRHERGVSPLSQSK